MFSTLLFLILTTRTSITFHEYQLIDKINTKKFFFVKVIVINIMKNFIS